MDAQSRDSSHQITTSRIRIAVVNLQPHRLEKTTTIRKVITMATCALLPHDEDKALRLEKVENLRDLQVAVGGYIEAVAVG